MQHWWATDGEGCSFSAGLNVCWCSHRCSHAHRDKYSISIHCSTERLKCRPEYGTGELLRDNLMEYSHAARLQHRRELLFLTQMWGGVKILHALGTTELWKDMRVVPRRYCGVRWLHPVRNLKSQPHHPNQLAELRTCCKKWIRENSINWNRGLGRAGCFDSVHIFCGGPPLARCHSVTFFYLASIYIRLIMCVFNLTCVNPKP